MHNLSKSSKVLQLTWNGTDYQLATGVDGGAINSTGIDTLGYQSLMIIAGTGAHADANGSLAIKLQHDTDVAFGTATDITLPTTTVQVLTGTAADKRNRYVKYDVHRPTKRYIRVQSQRTAGNIVLGTLFAILYNPSFAAPTELTTEGSNKATPIVIQGPATA